MFHAESLTFGLGVSFLLFGYPLVRSVGPASRSLSRAAHLSITWLLANWWIHDNLHAKAPLTLETVLGIEYAFHFSLMVAGGVLAYFYLRAIGQRRTVPL